jgi:hypothetical protein
MATSNRYTRDIADTKVLAAVEEQKPMIAELKAGKLVLGDNPLTVIRAWPSGDCMGESVSSRTIQSSLTR